MSSIEIDLWLQDAIEERLTEHVRDLIRERESLEEPVFIGIHAVRHNCGSIEVAWSFTRNPRAPTSHKNGTMSFTLAEVLRICMTDGKEGE